MTKLKCIKQPQRAKNVTVDQEYEGSMLDTNGNQTQNFNEATYFFCKNNKGNQAAYKIALFEEDQPEPLPLLKLDEILERVTIEIQNNGSIEYQILYNNVQIGKDYFVTNVWNQLSCGIKQMAGLESMIECIDEIVTNLDNFETEGFELQRDNINIDDLARGIIKKIFEKLLGMTPQNLNAKFLILSNVDDDYDWHWDILNELSICDQTKNFGINPNSDNNISVWVFKLEDDE